LNPLLSIWTKPTETINYVLANKTYSYGFFILLLASISTGIIAFSGTGYLDAFPLPAIILISILVTYAVSIPGWFINAALYTWVGKMLGGKGNYKQLALITPIGSIPTILMLPFNLLIILMYGKELFALPTSNFGITNMGLSLYILSNIILMALGVYSTVVMSKGIGLVHEFSAWRGFGTIMLIVLFVLILAIVFSIVIGIFFFMVLS
jgi:hypothetical protein